MRGLCSLLSLCLMVMMMVEAVAPVVGVGGASEGENGLLQRVLLLALCIRAIAARQAHARGAPQRGDLPGCIAVTTMARPQSRQASWLAVVSSTCSCLVKAAYTACQAATARASNLTQASTKHLQHFCTSSSTSLANLGASSCSQLCKAVAILAHSTYHVAKGPPAAFVGTALAYCTRKSWAACKVLAPGTARVCLVTAAHLTETMLAFSYKTVNTIATRLTQKPAVPQETYITATTKPSPVTMERASKALPAGSRVEAAAAIVKEVQPEPLTAGVATESSFDMLQSQLCSTPPRVSEAGAFDGRSSTSSSRRSSVSYESPEPFASTSSFSFSSPASATAVTRSQPAPLDLSQPAELDSSRACSSACSYYAHSPVAAARSYYSFNPVFAFDESSSSSSCCCCCSSPKSNLASFLVYHNPTFMGASTPPAAPAAAPAATPAAAAIAAAPSVGQAGHVTKVLNTVVKHLQKQDTLATPVAAPRADTPPTSAGSSGSSSSRMTGRAAPRRAAVPQAHLKLRTTTTTSSSGSSGKTATTTEATASPTTTTTPTTTSRSSSRAVKSADVVTRLTQAGSVVVPKKPLTLATCKVIARKAGTAAGGAAAVAAAAITAAGSCGKAVRRWV